MDKLKNALNKVDTDYAEIHLEEREVTDVQYRGNDLEYIGSRKESGGNVRSYHKGGWGFVSFNKLSDINDYVKSACNYAKYTSSGSNGKLNFNSKIVDKINIIPPKDPRNISLEEKETLARHYNSIILSSPSILTTNVIYRDVYTKRTFINNLGVDVTEERLYCGMMLGAVARDGSNIQTSNYSTSKTTDYNNVLGLEKDAERVAKEASDLLKADKVSAGVYTIVADPHLAGVFCHEAFGHLSEADHVYGNPKLMEIMKLGKRFGKDELSIVDDGSLQGEQGFYKYDDEGTPSQKTYLIKDGILSGRLHSIETAGELGEPISGNARALTYRFRPIVRMSCTYIEPREKSFEEMIGGIENGIYARESLGGMTQLEMFTFSAAKAYLIKNGKIGPMVRDVILAGNIFKTLQDIDAIGNDLKIFGSLGGCGKDGQAPLPVSMGSPHIRIQNVVIGGK